MLNYNSVLVLVSVLGNTKVSKSFRVRRGQAGTLLMQKPEHFLFQFYDDCDYMDTYTHIYDEILKSKQTNSIQKYYGQKHYRKIKAKL